jgi:hypothetical protein
MRRINKQWDWRAATSCKPDTVAKATAICPPPHQCVLGIDNDLLYSGMEDGSIPSTVAPHNHWRNLAKEAIQTFKDHFIAILCGADKSFFLNLWDRLLP